MDEFKICIVVNEEGANYRASGSMTGSSVKLMIAELELIKLRLLSDYEASLDNNEPTQRFEFG